MVGRQAVRRLFGALIVTALMVVGAGLGGCVTTVTDPVFGQKVSKSKAIDSYVQAALDYLRKGDTQNAMRHLKKAQELDKNSAKVQHALALTLEMDGEFDLADKHFQKALRLKPDFTQARNNYAAFLYRRGHYQKACDQMRRVTADTLYDNRTEAFANLGTCELKIGKTDAAEKAFERAVGMDHTYTPALLALASINLDQGDFVVAQKYYDDYRTVARQTARSLWIGVRLADHFNDANAQASYALALRNLFPHSPQYQLYRKRYGDQ